MKRILLTLAAAAAVVVPLTAAAAPPPAPAATPLTPVYCTYGDNFYHFVSDYSDSLQYINTDFTFTPVLGDDLGNTSNDLFCQTNVTGGFSEWVKKGTSSCLTLDATLSYDIDLKTCTAGKASQLWGLADNQGGEVWGGIQSDYTAAGFRYLHDADPGPDQGLQGWAPSPGSPWEYRLDGPYR